MKRTKQSSLPDKLPKPKFKHPTQLTRGERAVAILNAPVGLVAHKQIFLKAKGVTDSEFTEALDIASNGKLLRAAGLQGSHRGMPVDLSVHPTDLWNI